MSIVQSIDALDALYGAAAPNSLRKVVTRLTPPYATWINAARFCVLTTVGPEGTDGSPRGDDGPVVRMVNDTTLHLPDWRGNNRIDSLRNIVRDGRVSLLFMVPGSSNVVRVNGTAVISVDPALTRSFRQRGRTPKCVIVITVGEAYFQCSKAILRSGLWDEQGAPDVPSAGDFLQDQVDAFDGKAYDDNDTEHAKANMW